MQSFGRRMTGMRVSRSSRFRVGLQPSLLTTAIVAGIALLATPLLSTARVSSQNGSPTNVVTRACKSNPAGSKRSKGASDNRRKKPGATGMSATSACIEAHSTALDIQEYLQARGREQKWNLSDEHVAEDAWTFSRKLEKDELLRYTMAEANSQSVNWTSGEAFVQVKTADLEDGFVRVQVSARFQGFGHGADQFAPPKESWPLKSNNTLETQFISMLEAHFKNTP
jgi:hypothetical protein